MIRTEWRESFDLLKAIEPGSRVGILGCSDCSSVYRTGDTKRIEQTISLIQDHCKVAFATSLGSPCDQRSLRLLLKSRPEFLEVDTIIVLACVAGSSSLADLLVNLAGATRPRVVSPVATCDFTIIGRDSVSRRACRFCKTCLFSQGEETPGHINGLCPVAVCPVGRSDGPCQSRVSDNCVICSDMICSWLSHGSETDSLPFPARETCTETFGNPYLLLSTGHAMDYSRNWITALEEHQCMLKVIFDSMAGIRACTAIAGNASLFLNGVKGDSRKLLSLGICIDTLQISREVLYSELLTARETGVDTLLLRDPSAVQNWGCCPLGTTEILEIIASDFAGDFTVIVANSFLREADLELLSRQFILGVDLAGSVVRHAASSALHDSEDNSVLKISPLRERVGDRVVKIMDLRDEQPDYIENGDFFSHNSFYCSQGRI